MGDDKKKEKKSKKKSEKTASESEADAPAGDAPSEPKRATRGTSNVFALFKQAQIQEFKEDKKKEKKEKKEKKKEKEESSAAEESAPAEAPRKPTGNVFAMFKQAQIQEFKEAFQMMDCDRDGFISKDDLAGIFQQTGRDADAKTLDAMLSESPGQLNFTHFLNLFGEKLHGRNPSDDVLKSMIEEAPGPINFTVFLTIFGDKLKGTDPERTLMDAFKMFDPEEKGKLKEDYFKMLMTEVGDLFSKDEMKQTMKEAPIEGGFIDYVKFVQLIKRGKEEEA